MLPEMELALTEQKENNLISTEYEDWIDVRLDLPPKGKTVLVYGCNPAASNTYFVSMGSFIMMDDRMEQFWLMVAPKHDVVYMVKARVSHWREMPKPPKSSKPW